MGDVGQEGRVPHHGVYEGGDRLDVAQAVGDDVAVLDGAGFELAADAAQRVGSFPGQQLQWSGHREVVAQAWSSFGV